MNLIRAISVSLLLSALSLASVAFGGSTVGSRLDGTPGQAVGQGAMEYDSAFDSQRPGYDPQSDIFEQDRRIRLQKNASKLSSRLETPSNSLLRSRLFRPSNGRAWDPGSLTTLDSLQRSRPGTARR